MKKIMVELDFSEKWLDKQRELECSDGFKRPIDGFRVEEISKTGKTVEVAMFQWKKPEGYENFLCACDLPVNVRKRGFVWMTTLKKRINYVGDSMEISIAGQRYRIGTFKEVS